MLQVRGKLGYIAEMTGLAWGLVNGTSQGAAEGLVIREDGEGAAFRVMMKMVY